MCKKLDFIIVICYTKVRFGRPPAIFLQGETGRMGEHASTAKDRIIDSFLSFYEHKPLQDIFVSDICADCGISRGTFYYHFTDVYDLCEQLENGLIRDMEADLNLSIMYTTAGRHREPDDQRYIKAYEECLKKYVDKAEFYHVLLSGSHGVSFHRAWTESVYRMLDITMQFANLPPEQALLVRRFFAGGLVTLLARWLSCGCREKPYDIAWATNQMLFHGVFLA